MAKNSRQEPDNLEMPAVLFDLDGTLVDSVYQHVNAWSNALIDAGVNVPLWEIHRRVGMSGKSAIRDLLRQEHARHNINLDELESKHDEAFNRAIPAIQPLQKASQLLRHLRRSKIRVAIATTGNRKQTSLLLKKLELPFSIPVLTGDDVEKAKPSPDIFVAAAQSLAVAISDCIVVGDSVWDLLAAGRKNALGVGLLSGGYGQDELERAGAFRVYAGPAEMLLHLEQLGLPGLAT